VVIVGVLIGASLLGVLGALVAIPIAAAVQIVARDVWRNRQERLIATESPDPKDLPPDEPLSGSGGPAPAPASG
jgi:predicted PurR-regulated permease PerM